MTALVLDSFGWLFGDRRGNGLAVEPEMVPAVAALSRWELIGELDAGVSSLTGPMSGVTNARWATAAFIAHAFYGDDRPVTVLHSDRRNAESIFSGFEYARGGQPSVVRDTNDIDDIDRILPHLQRAAGGLFVVGFDEPTQSLMSDIADASEAQQTTVLVLQDELTASVAMHAYTAFHCATDGQTPQNMTKVGVARDDLGRSNRLQFNVAWQPETGYTGAY